MSAFTAAQAQSVIEQFEVQQPRTYGYQIGDKLVRSITLKIKTPYQLDEASLPSAGRLTDWLSLEKPRVNAQRQSGVTRYDIQLSYQLVNIDHDVSDLALPEHLLRYHDGEHGETLQVRAIRFHATPLRAADDRRLHPDQEPGVMLFNYQPALWSALALLLAMGVLFWVRGEFSFGRHKPAFAEVYHRLKHSPGQDLDALTYQHTLREIHHAFNHTAGRTLFVETLDAFFVSHPAYVSSQQAITDYFLHSRQYFFVGTNAAAPAQYTRSDLLDLIRACRDIERGMA